MLLCHMLGEHTPEDVSFHSPCTPTSKMEQSINTSIQSMKTELSSQAAELFEIQNRSSSMVQGQLREDMVLKDGEPMDADNEDRSKMTEITEEAQKILDVQRAFKADHLKLGDSRSKILVVDKDRLKHMEATTYMNKQQTDSVVKELAQNITQNLKS